MLRNWLILVLMLPIWLTAQNRSILPNFHSLKSHPKAGVTLKLWAEPSARPFFYRTGEGKIAIMGAFKGSRSLVEQQLQSCNANYSIFQRVFTIEVNPEDIIKLLNSDEIIYLEASTRFNSPRPLDDKALLKSKVPQAQSIKMPPFKGKNVVLGIVDVGFQTTHPTFFNEDGSQYRVKRFWQQKYKNLMGPAPYNYGILKNSEAEILAAIDTDGSHGTHVAGIAGGSGFKSPELKYAGVAPESDLVFVGIKYQNDSIGGSALGDYIVANNAIIDGFDYVFRYADSLNKPAVCNLSWGMHTGPHDGTSIFDLALEDLINTPNSNTNKPQGRALVGANGNSAQHEMHVKIVLNGDSASTLAMDRSRNNYFNENVYCDFWAEKNSDLHYQIVLIDSLDRILVETPYYDFAKDTMLKLSLSSFDDTLDVLLSGTKTYAFNGKSNVLMMVQANSNKRFIKINFKGSGEVHGWNSGRTYEWTAGTFRNYIRSYKPSHWVNGDAVSTLVENGGTSSAILSVGSYNNRVNWLNFQNKFQSDSAIDEGQISGFSSWGPTIDGRLNPDISAPGQFIANAYHKDAVPGWLSPYIVHKDKWVNDDVYWVLLSGTSMAAPHAAGVVALMLEASEGKLTAAEMYDIIRNTAQQDVHTGNKSNFRYGAGKIDAYAAVLASLNALRTRVHKVETPLVFGRANEMVVKGCFNSQFPIDYQIFETTGRVVYKGQSNVNVLPFNGISTGIYVVRISQGSQQFTQTIYLEGVN
jgi:minor extracellular serine protease Vpr